MGMPRVWPSGATSGAQSLSIALSNSNPARDAMIAALAERSDAVLVQRIGHVAVLYRPSRDKRQIVLPRA